VTIDPKREMLRHFLAALAYRTQKALRGAPESFAGYRASPQTRTPHEIVHHMQSVLGYARTFFVGGEYWPEMQPAFEEQVRHFHEMLDSVGGHLESAAPFVGTTPERMLQGPFADAMSHAGQLAMLRRLAGSPVPPENFIVADMSPDNLGPDQPAPVSPDEEWPEAPE
jgi:hypothetical protein